MLTFYVYVCKCCPMHDLCHMETCVRTCVRASLQLSRRRVVSERDRTQGLTARVGRQRSLRPPPHPRACPVHDGRVAARGAASRPRRSGLLVTRVLWRGIVASTLAERRPPDRGVASAVPPSCSHTRCDKDNARSSRWLSTEPVEAIRSGPRRAPRRRPLANLMCVPNRYLWRRPRPFPAR